MTIQYNRDVAETRNIKYFGTPQQWNDLFWNIIIMEEPQQPQAQQPPTSPPPFPSNKPRVIACFQQPQTISILGYLLVQPHQTIVFQSQFKHEQTKKKSREFQFDNIFMKDMKMVHECLMQRNKFNLEVNEAITGLVQGKDQAILMYGIEEPSKQKLLYGDPRDPGIMLLLMEQLFGYCHRHKLESQVTVKMSFASYQRGKFRDLLINSKKPLKLCHDTIQKDYLLGQSEIIVRNLKTAIKIIKIAFTNCLTNRQDEEVGSECMIFQIKLEIQSATVPNQYQISKLKLIKFADPSLNQNPTRDTIKINERNRWAINLDNCLRECCMLESQHTTNMFKKEDLTMYLKSIILGQAKVTCFISLTNKLSQNDCLNLLLFSYYISKINCQPHRTLLSVPSLKCQAQQLQQFLLQTLHTILQTHPECRLFQIQRLIGHQMDLTYELQCEYSKLLSASCATLTKYVMNEDIEEFFYCKKESIMGNPEVVRLLEGVDNTRERVEHYVSNLGHMAGLGELGKKEIRGLKRLLEIYRCEALHFFYERSDLFKRHNYSGFRKSSTRNPRVSSLKPRDSFASTQNLSIFKSPDKVIAIDRAYKTQQLPKPTKLASFKPRTCELKPIARAPPRPRPAAYEDFITAMFFNDDMQSL